MTLLLQTLEGSGKAGVLGPLRSGGSACRNALVAALGTADLQITQSTQIVTYFCTSLYGFGAFYSLVALLDAPWLQSSSAGYRHKSSTLARPCTFLKRKYMLENRDTWMRARRWEMLFT